MTPKHSAAAIHSRSDTAITTDIALGLVVPCVLALYAFGRALLVGDACHSASTLDTLMVAMGPMFAWLVMLALPIVRGQTLGMVICARRIVHEGGAPARWRVAASFSFLAPVLVACLVSSFVMFFSTTVTVVLGLAAIALLVLTWRVSARLRPTRLVPAGRSLPFLGLLMFVSLSIIAVLQGYGEHLLSRCPAMFAIDTALVDVKTGNALLIDGNAGVIMVNGTSGRVLRVGLPGRSLPYQLATLVSVDGHTGRVFTASSVQLSSSDRETGVIATIDARTGRLLRMVPVHGRPNSIIIDEHTGRVFVPDASGIVTMLDDRTGRALRSVRVGKNPGTSTAVGERGQYRGSS